MPVHSRVIPVHVGADMLLTDFVVYLIGILNVDGADRVPFEHLVESQSVTSPNNQNTLEVVVREEGDRVMDQHLVKRSRVDRTTLQLSLVVNSLVKTENVVVILNDLEVAFDICSTRGEHVEAKVERPIGVIAEEVRAIRQESFPVASVMVVVTWSVEFKLKGRGGGFPGWQVDGIAGKVNMVRAKDKRVFVAWVRPGVREVIIPKRVLPSLSQNR
mmetsp:Transcript_15826/g.30966  ORF Transcript_15826/g.30966 Transcript_15826/m.30966 type:complete len:216 (-) Transcript_15826:708-1355(-)